METKTLLDFDGTLTDEVKQAEELAIIAKNMLSEILDRPLTAIEELYEEIKWNILARPEAYRWFVNGQPASYAHEGAYIINTVILQEMICSHTAFVNKIKKQFPAGEMDSVTQCVNHLFHMGSSNVDPHFLLGVRDFLVDLMNHPDIDPAIFTNSKTDKIARNLANIQIGKKGDHHDYDKEIEVIGDTQQYFIDPSWPGPLQILPIDHTFRIDLRRPKYYQALRNLTDQGYDIIVAADGFSLAGALPLTMNLKFILLKTDYTPNWSENYVHSHPNGKVVKGIEELHQAIIALTNK